MKRYGLFFTHGDATVHSFSGRVRLKTKVYEFVKNPLALAFLTWLVVALLLLLEKIR